MYQALYRKWRPQTFDDVVGQEHITVTLKRQVAADRLLHAYLFVGTRGTGKTTCAKILARAVNCEHPVDGDPCNECAACRGILDGSVLDVVELDAASNNKVDDVRALQDEAIFSPASVKKRVYIIDEVHMLSTAAFNALLKILEEPPEHLLFILCTTELHKVLPTIISRCQRHSFKRIEPQAIARRLAYVAAQEGIDLTDDAAALLARLADGGMRDALSLLDQCSAQEHIDAEAVHTALGLAGSRRIEELLEAICSRQTDRALSLFDALWRDGKDPAGILEELGDLLRDVLIASVAPRGGEALLSGVYDRAAIERFSQKMSGSDLMDAMAAIRGADLSGSNPRRAAEMCLVSLSVPETGDSLTALRSRVSRLEAALQGGAAAAAIASAPETAAKPAAPETAPKPAEAEPPAPKPAAETPPPAPAAPPADDMPWYTDDDAPPEEPNYAPPWSDEPPAAAPAPAKAASASLKPVPPKAAPPTPPPASREMPKAASPTQAGSESPASAPSGGDDALWTSLLRSLAGKIDVSSLAFLNTPTQCSGSMNGDVLSIRTATPFVRKMIERPENTEAIRRELKSMLGREVSVVFSDGSEPPSSGPKEEKLEALRRFPNVTIE